MKIGIHVVSLYCCLKCCNQVPYDTENVMVTLDRAEPIDPNSTCAEYERNYNAGDIRSISLSPGMKLYPETFMDDCDRTTCIT